MSHILTFTTLIIFLTYLTNAQLSLYASRDDDLIAGKRVSAPTWIRRTIAADDDAVYNPYQGMNGIRVGYVTRDTQRPLKQRKGKKTKKPKKPKKAELLYADDDDIFGVPLRNIPSWIYISTPEPQYRNEPAQYNNPRARTQAALADDDVFAGLVYNIPQKWNKPVEYKFINPSKPATTPSWVYNKLAISDDDAGYNPIKGMNGIRIKYDARKPRDSQRNPLKRRKGKKPKKAQLLYVDDDAIFRVGRRPSRESAVDSDEALPYYVIEEQKRRGDDDHIAGVRASYGRSNRRSGTTSTDDDERIRINDPSPTFPLPKKPIWVDDDDEHIGVNYDGASYRGGKSANIIYADDDLIAGQRADVYKASDHDEIIRIQHPGKPIRPTYPVWTLSPSRPRPKIVYADDDEYTRINYGGASNGGPVRPIWVDDDMIAGQRVLRG